MKVSAIITLKKDVLDPQGKVIHQTLDGMGFKDINEELLLDTLKKFESKNFEFDKLKVNYWIDKIKSDTLNSENIYYIRIPKLNIYFLKISFTVNRFINRSSKKILFRFRQIRRKIKDI